MTIEVEVVTDWCDALGHPAVVEAGERSDGIEDTWAISTGGPLPCLAIGDARICCLCLVGPFDELQREFVEWAAAMVAAKERAAAVDAAEALTGGAA